MLANTVRIQLRTKDFVDYSHQKKLAFPTSSTKEVILLAKNILNDMYKNEPIRLIGLSVDNLDTKEDTQMSFFEPSNEKQEKIDNVLDSLKNRYGYQAIKRAGELEIQEIVKGKEKK